MVPLAVVKRLIRTNAACASLKLEFTSCRLTVVIAAEIEAIGVAIILVHNPVPKSIPVYRFDPDGQSDVIRVQRVTIGNDDPVGEIGNMEEIRSAEFTL